MNLIHKQYTQHMVKRKEITSCGLVNIECTDFFSFDMEKLVKIRKMYGEIKISWVSVKGVHGILVCII